MSYISQMNQYASYSNLLSSTFNTGSSFPTSGLVNLYSSLYSSSKAKTNQSSSSQINSSSQAVKDYITDIKETSEELLSAVKGLNKKGKDSLFGTINAKSNDSAVSASFNGEDVPDDFEVGVSSVAKKQVNQSTALKANSSSLYQSKEHTVNITTKDGKTASFYIPVNVTSSNEDVLNKLADKINDKKLGITASVEVNEKKGTVSLKLTSKETGTDNEFYVSGGLAEELGINKVSQEAQNAVYTIDGDTYESQSNTVKFDNGVSLTFNKTTDENAEITFGEDNTKAINATRDFVNKFNDFADTAYGLNDSGALSLAKKLQSAVRTYSSSLSKIGISMNKSGYLEIDEDKMKKAAENGDLAKFFGQDSKSNIASGFSRRIETIAANAASVPESTLSQGAKKALNNTNISSASSSYDLSNTKFSSYQMNVYNRYSMASMLFDAMF